MSNPQSAPYRRALLFDALEPGRVGAEMEDDFHRFRVVVEHRDGAVTGVAADAIRHPWSLCPAAAQRLQLFVGAPLTPSMAEALGWSAVREHCTHMYDLVCLAIVHAARRTPSRRWDMSVDPPAGGPRQAWLAVDGVEVMRWTVLGTDIVDPLTMSLKGDFVQSAARIMDRESAERAILLRRAVFVSGGRRQDLDDRATAADRARNLGGCFVMQPMVAPHAARMRGSTRTFGSDTAPLDAL